MSYYRPSTLRIAAAHDEHDKTQVEGHVNAVASSSRLSVVGETSPPIIIGKAGGARKTHRLSVHEQQMWMAKFCTYSPLGQCKRLQARNSMFCIFHACQATNVDGELCGNFVKDPSQTRFCSSGWHAENGSDSHLHDMMARRRKCERVEHADRQTQYAAQLSYFEQHFPNADMSPTTAAMSMRSSSSDGHGQRHRSSPPDKVERGWGSHGVDRWWEGRWSRLSQMSGGSAGQGAAQAGMVELPFMRRGS